MLFRRESDNLAEILKEEYKKQIKLGRPLKGETREGKSRPIVDVANSIGVSTTKLKKYKSIAKHEPSLLKDIDLGLLSVERAYQIVRTKYIVGEEDKKYDVQKFSIQMKRLLSNYSFPKEFVNDLIEEHYNKTN